MNNIILVSTTRSNGEALKTWKVAKNKVSGIEYVVGDKAGVRTAYKVTGYNRAVKTNGTMGYAFEGHVISGDLASKVISCAPIQCNSQVVYGTYKDKNVSPNYNPAVIQPEGTIPRMGDEPTKDWWELQDELLVKAEELFEREFNEIVNLRSFLYPNNASTSLNRHDVLSLSTLNILVNTRNTLFHRDKSNRDMIKNMGVNLITDVIKQL